MTGGVHNEAFCACESVWSDPKKGQKVGGCFHPQHSLMSGIQAPLIAISNTASGDEVAFELLGWVSAVVVTQLTRYSVELLDKS